MVAISYLPHTFKVLWAPVIDTTLSNRIWYLLSTVVTGVLDDLRRASCRWTQ